MKSNEPKRKNGGKAATWESTESNRVAGSENRRDHIATAAYYKAEARGFTPGLEVDDWLEAETDLNKSAGS